MKRRKSRYDLGGSKTTEIKKRTKQDPGKCLFSRRTTTREKNAPKGVLVSPVNGEGDKLMMRALRRYSLTTMISIILNVVQTTIWSKKKGGEEFLRRRNEKRERWEYSPVNLGLSRRNIKQSYKVRQTWYIG